MTKAQKISAIMKARGVSASSTQGKALKKKMMKMKAASVTRLYNDMEAQAVSAGQQVVQQMFQGQVVVQAAPKRRRSTGGGRSYASKTLTQLRAIAKKKKLKGYSTLKKAQLIKAIKAGPKKSSSGRTAVKKPSKTNVSRANAIARAIRSGKISAKNSNIPSYTAYQSGTRKQKVDRFVAQYKGVRIAKKSSGPKRESVAGIYQGMAAPKQPYFLSRGYKVDSFKVGGGRKGPGTVRKVAGKQGLPFKKLTAADKKKIIAFLNSSTGKKLRGVGAPQSASLQKMQQAKMAKAQRKRAATLRRKAKSQQKKAASANMFYGWY